MNLIATNKIAGYIEQHPEARVPLLTWLKEFPYQQARWNSLDHEGKLLSGCGAGWFGVGTGEYSGKCVLNFDTKTQIITWVGNEAERKIETDREIKESLKKYPNAVTRTVSVTETVVVPPPPPAPYTDPEMDSFTFTTIAGGISTVNEKRRDPVAIYEVPALPAGEGFQSEEEYEEGLSRASEIFAAEPGTFEFEELLVLLHLIREFENHKLKFPMLHNFEIVKDRLEMFKMKPTDLPAIDGGEEQINLFLSGQLELSDEIVGQMFKVLFIRIPIGDKRFSL
jgi:antitoxin component HigA of HigAB toxin-antitoxin module